MELTLGRQDILQVSTLNRGCMRLLPKSTKRGHGRQNVVVGDDTGSLLVFGVSAKKSSDIETVFKTPAAAKSAISRVVLAGEPGGTLSQLGALPPRLCGSAGRGLCRCGRFQGGAGEKRAGSLPAVRRFAAAGPVGAPAEPRAGRGRPSTCFAHPSGIVQATRTGSFILRAR